MSRLYLLTRAGEWLRYMVPENARFEIVCYDRAGTFQPGTFRFAAPPPGRRLGDRANQTNIPHKRSGKKRGKPLHLTNLSLDGATVHNLAQRPQLGELIPERRRRQLIGP